MWRPSVLNTFLSSQLSFRKVDAKTCDVKGLLRVNVHYYEDGNVQLQSKKEVRARSVYVCVYWCCVRLPLFSSPFVSRLPVGGEEGDSGG
jgi:hypothetical protein